MKASDPIVFVAEDDSCVELGALPGAMRPVPGVETGFHSSAWSLKIWRKWQMGNFGGFLWPNGPKKQSPGFTRISAKIIVRRLDGRIAFVPEGTARQ
jgi:hypothetical protein